MFVRHLPASLLLAAAASCAVPPPSPVPLDAVGVGLACRGNGDGARTGMTFAYWGSGYRGWGSYAKVRVDVATGAAFFVGNTDSDDYDDDDDDDPYIDDYTGAIVIDAGLVYRFADAFAVYGGAGLGYLYALDSTVDAYDDVDRHTDSLDFGPAASAGLLWLWGNTGMGLDVGYDTFDKSYRLGVVFNFAGMNGGGGG